MNTLGRNFSFLALLAVSLLAPAFGQNRSQFGGQYNALSYAYGINPNVTPLSIVSGNAATGTQTITVAFGQIVASDGTAFTPLAANTPIFVGGASNQETMTPTSVSCSTPLVYGTCSLTGVFVNTHGQGEAILSASYGLQEAANVAMLNGGGVVVTDRNWARMGAATSNITGASLSGTVTGLGAQNGFAPTVTVMDTRTLPITYWAPRPTTLSLIAAGSAATLTQQAGGSLTGSGTYRYTYEYVDPLGGISLPATTSSQITLTGSNQTITATAPAATAGAVGYIPMITASGGADGTQIEVPVTSSICTLATTLSASGKPICAISSTAVIAANPSSTAKEVVEGTAHTTFAPQPFGALPQPLQTQYGPFVATATLNNSNADAAQFYTPAGYFNFLGKSWQVCVKGATATQVASSVLAVKLEATTQYAQSPVVISTITFPTQTQAAAGTFEGCWIITTAATGASGTFWVSTPAGSWHNFLNSAPGTQVVSADASAAASSTVDLTSGLYWSVNLTETASNNITGPKINVLTINPVNNN